VRYSHSFDFTAAAATAAAGGLAITNGLGRLIMGSISGRFGRANSMILSYILCGVFLFITLVAGRAHNETFFVVCTLLAIFFWGPLFSLFPTLIGHYYGETAAGSNYGILYAIAKGSGGIYGGVLSAILITQPVSRSQSARRQSWRSSRDCSSSRSRRARR
jgi:OFA family oxalate/formate antiporter-like MFS transporter